MGTTGSVKTRGFATIMRNISYKRNETSYKATFPETKNQPDLLYQTEPITVPKGVQRSTEPIG